MSWNSLIDLLPVAYADPTQLRSMLDVGLNGVFRSADSLGLPEVSPKRSEVVVRTSWTFHTIASPDLIHSIVLDSDPTDRHQCRWFPHQCWRTLSFRNADAGIESAGTCRRGRQ